MSAPCLTGVPQYMKTRRSPNVHLKFSYFLISNSYLSFQNAGISLHMTTIARRSRMRRA
jgi:hypothetical protein